MTGRNSAISSVWPPEPSLKKIQTKRSTSDNSKMACRDAAAFHAAHPGVLTSLVGSDAVTGALRHGIPETISAIPETENTWRLQGGLWLPFLDTYRTMCLAPQSEFREVLEQVRSLLLAA
jgi:hypothetical protein